MVLTHKGLAGELVETDRMEKSVEVKIHWVGDQFGGKRVLPHETLCYVMTELLKGASGVEANWSLVLQVEGNAEFCGNRVGFGKAWFLTKDAPFYLLKKGYSLAVHEGSKLIATLEVI